MSYSIQRAVSDGNLTSIALSIVYVDRSTIHVYVDDIEMDMTGGTTPYTWEWETPTKIKIAPAVPNGIIVTIRRATQTSEMYHNFDAGAVFKDESVDENFKQVLFLTQEYQETPAITDLFDNVDMHGNTFINLQDAVEEQSPVTLAQLNTYVADSAGERKARQDADANLQSQISGGTPLEASAFSPISWHDQSIENSVTIPPNKNAWSFGPTITITEGQAVTVSEGSFWTIANGEVQ